jgi:hypothetical protein
MNALAIDLAVHQLGKVSELGESEARKRLGRMLNQHEREWKNFIASLGPNSFIANWTASAR